MNKHEKIRETRTNEATVKNLMGSNGKFGIVVRYLGKPIMREGSSLFEASYLDDPYELPDDDMPTMEEDAQVFPVGYIFDGLSRGIHMEIRYNEDDKSIIASYGGYIIYREIGGELDAFVPFKEWEDKLELLYRVAKKTENEKRKENEELYQERTMEKHAKILDELRKRWGLQL